MRTINKIKERKVWMAVCIFLSFFFFSIAVWAEPLNENVSKTAKIEISIAGDAAEAEIMSGGEKSSLKKECGRVTSKLLGYAGFTIVEDTILTSDVTVKIKMQGEAKGARYVVLGGRKDMSGYFYYTGATLSGEILFLTPGKTESRPFSGRRDPPQNVGSLRAKARQPSNAPFKKLFDDYFLPNIMDMMGELFGYEVLIKALEDSYFLKEAVKTLRQKPQLTSQFIKTLDSDNSHMRYGAVQVLRKIGSKEAVDPLIKLLNDKDKSVRSVAVSALRELDSLKAVETLIKTLKDNEFSIRASAAQSLGKMGDTRAVEPLLRLLSDRNDYVQGSAVLALGMLGDSRAVAPIIEKLKVPITYSNNIALSAAAALGNIKDSAAVPALIQVLKSRKDEVLLERSIEALGKIGDPRAIDPINEVLENEQTNSGDIRLAAAEALSSLGNPDNVLSKLIKDNWWKVSIAAAEGLVKIGDPRAVESLISVLGHEDHRVRISACRGLAEIGDQSAIEHLIPLLGDEKEDVKEECSKALLSFGEAVAGALIKAMEDGSVAIRGNAAMLLAEVQPEAAIDPLLSLLKDSRYEIRELAAHLLGKLQAVEAVDYLVLLLGDTSMYVREASSVALGDIGRPALEPLMKALGNPEVKVRRAAGSALVHMGRESVPALITALESENPDKRAQAASALGNLKDPSAVNSLGKAFEDSETEVRKSVVYALRKMAHPAAFEPLMKALGDPMSDIRKHAVWGLGAIGDERAVPALIERLDDYVLRNAAREALIKIGKPAVEPLIQSLFYVSSKGNIVFSRRDEAIEALGEIKDRHAVPPLIQIVESGKDDYIDAALALGEIGDPRAVIPLCNLLKVAHESQIPKVVRALGALKDMRAVEPLIRLFLHENRSIRGSASVSLYQITGKRFTDHKRWMEWWEKVKRKYPEAPGAQVNQDD